jgi:hypothetical protein
MTLASSVKAPLYYAAGVLRDGAVLVAGGEYDSGNKVWLLNVEQYDPTADTWTTRPTPTGWVKIGDAPGCVLPDGRFVMFSTPPMTGVAELEVVENWWEPNRLVR